MQLQEQPKIYEKIIEKNGLKFVKLTPNKFNLTFDLNNNNILIPSIINFELIQLINKLNPNVFENLETNTETNIETNIVAKILLKDLFSDLGLPHYYLALNINKICSDTNKIVFICESIIINNKLDFYPDHIELLPIQNINIYCNIANNHSVKINCDIDLINSHSIPPFFEKMIGNIIYNIFNRLKQFIEKVSF
jgi:hypothetical protein